MHCNTRADLRGPTTIDNAVVPHQVADDAQSIMNTALGLLDNLEIGGDTLGQEFVLE